MQNSPNEEKRRIRKLIASPAHCCLKFQGASDAALPPLSALPPPPFPPADHLTKRIIACLDVRANDAGDLVVTKGDQYDVRDRSTQGESHVRNLGKPVDLAARYFSEGADEIAFLNITSFRDSPLRDLPMLQVLSLASRTVFVPLTIGGGIRDMVEPDGTKVSALDVAGEYFRSGADKVSIGSDAVLAAERYWARRGTSPDPSAGCSGDSAIEAIARVYGRQAVVVSIDPRRVPVHSPAGIPHSVIPTQTPGPAGETFVWFQCTVSGGREGRPIDVVALAKAVEALGAGEILLNSMDRDGTNSGFDIELVGLVRDAVSIPVVASSGAGKVEHFADVFTKTRVEAALAAGIFHREEVPLASVKGHLRDMGYEVRGVESSL
ncbi:hypothetical protein BDK51DRAFT_22475 [Blyttiomyces helicus]|uniref:Uncharacterized protein n=1 Tax=Blyttiomyces helicus TaxID=388810 RepID=A0A4P9W3V0_9FUNG|nr:hypothetical protein BDK51DRAFT_22475 [Blyttiomyces helicus]|eukprot:RKO85478.1 hypothetical protein BDK51DRAFT_22475 [Blyttiomyces helicus]